jgi:hypothetical protein
MAGRQAKVDLAATGTEPAARLSVQPAAPVAQIFIIGPRSYNGSTVPCYGDR